MVPTVGEGQGLNSSLVKGVTIYQLSSLGIVEIDQRVTAIAS